jgi:pilus assembly protein Flp/PilA
MQYKKTKEEVEMEKIKRFFKEEEGVTAIEYGLIASLIAVAIILAVTAVGGQLRTVFNAVTTALGGAAS